MHLKSKYVQCRYYGGRLLRAKKKKRRSILGQVLVQRSKSLASFRCLPCRFRRTDLDVQGGRSVPALPLAASVARSLLDPALAARGKSWSQTLLQRQHMGPLRVQPLIVISRHRFAKEPLSARFLLTRTCLFALAELDRDAAAKCLLV